MTTCTIIMGPSICGAVIINGRCPRHSSPYLDTGCRLCVGGVKHTGEEHRKEMT